jgi:hypothetical protein
MSSQTDRDKRLQTTTALSPVSDGYHELEQSDDCNPIGPFAKCVDGEWTIGGVPPDPNYRSIAIGIAHTLQCWKDQEKIDEIFDHPLPDVDDLNASVPKETWGIGLNGEPRPPWSHAYKVFLLDTETGERVIYANNTAGAKIAYGRLKDQVQWMRRMKGCNVVPRVKLSQAPMPTRYGLKKRPHFEVIEWLNLDGGTPSLPDSSNSPQLTSGGMQKVEEPSVAEELNDEIKF